MVDDGAGLPEGFDLEASPRLGLQIVRTLVVGELSGAINLRPREGGGTEAVLDLPLPPCGWLMPTPPASLDLTIYRSPPHD